MVRKLVSFVDILQDRRTELSNIAWASRDLSNFIVPNRQIKRVSPNSHKGSVLNSPRIQELIYRVSVEQNIPKEEIENQVSLILDEIGFKKSLTIIRWLAIFLCKFTCKTCTHLYVNEDSLKQVKVQLGNTPTIYVPSHRSYADFILMSYMLFSTNMEIPAIAAGMDFHSMFGMGTVLRNTGAFFMRRIYNSGDNLYWDTFRQYVHDLVTKGDVGIEFFLEGTRSRSCKSLSPKYGLLFMILRAFVTGEVPDILFVPINISYDRVMEEKLFAFELLGVPKPKESTSGFFKALSIVRENFGNIYMDFGEPISVKSYFGAKINRARHCMKPVHAQELFDDEKAEMVTLAEHIVHKQQKLCTITTFNLIAIVLSSCFAQRRTIMRFDQLVIEVIWLKTIITRLGALTDAEYPRKNVQESLKVHKNLVNVDELGNVTLLQNAIVLDDFKESRLKGHALSESTMTVSVPFVMLQLYVNPTMHYFADPAMIVSVIRSGEKCKMSTESLFQEFKFLKDLFSYEFIHLKDNIKSDFETCSGQLTDLRVICKEESAIIFGDNEKLKSLLQNLIDPFFYCYFIVCNILTNLKTLSFEEKSVLASSQAKLEELLYNQEEFVHPYVLSLDSISMCLQSLVTMNVLKKNRLNGSVKYEIQGDLLFETTNRLGKYIKHKKSLNSETRTEALHLLKNKL